MNFRELEHYMERLAEENARSCPFCGEVLATRAVELYDEEGSEAGRLRRVRLYWCEAAAVL